MADYIPTDLDDALDELDRTTSDADKAFVRMAKSSDVFHHGPGTGLRNNWGLWHNSRLAKWFESRGIFHADDMSGLILTAWFCRLRGEVFDFEKEKRVYLDHWKRMGCDASGRSIDG